MDLETLNRVTMDIVLGIPPEQSKLTYTPELRAQRKRLEEQIANRPPGSIVHIPSE